MKRNFFLAALGLVAWLHAPPARAEPIVALTGGTSTPITWGIDGNTLDVFLPAVAGLAPIFLQFSGLAANHGYLVNAKATNASDGGWGSVGATVLKPVNRDEDTGSGRPSWAPPGLVNSDEADGFSFAQRSQLPRVSDRFTDVFADEETDVRDFLRFSGGLVSPGSSVQLTFGIRDFEGDRPFVVALTPGAATPEPATLLMLGTGVLGLSAAVRKRRSRA
jgi:hypothetical protein